MSKEDLSAPLGQPDSVSRVVFVGEERASLTASDSERAVEIEHEVKVALRKRAATFMKQYPLVMASVVGLLVAAGVALDDQFQNEAFTKTVAEYMTSFVKNQPEVAIGAIGVGLMTILTSAAQAAFSNETTRQAMILMTNAIILLAELVMLPLVNQLGKEQAKTIMATPFDVKDHNMLARAAAPTLAGLMAPTVSSLAKHLYQMGAACFSQKQAGTDESRVQELPEEVATTRQALQVEPGQ